MSHMNLMIDVIKPTQFVINYAYSCNTYYVTSAGICGTDSWLIYGLKTWQLTVTLENVNVTPGERGIAMYRKFEKWQFATFQKRAKWEKIEITSSSCFHRSKLFFRGQKLAISQTKGGERVCKTSNNRNSNNNNNGNKSNNNIRWCASTLCWWKPLKTWQSTYWMEDDTMEMKEGLPGG